MSDWFERVVESRGHVAPRWSREREEQIQARLQSARQSAGRARLAAGASLCAIAVAACLLFWQNRADSHRAVLVEHFAAPQVPLLTLPDGTRVTSADSSAHLDRVALSETAVDLRLVRGSAHFEVTPNPHRAFRVMAGSVRVSVLGTIFEVALDEHTVRVSVERGRVRVESRNQARELGVGQSATIATEPDRPSAPEPGEPAMPHTSTRADIGHPSLSRPHDTGASIPTWRESATKGDYQAAYGQLSRAHFQNIGVDPSDLLLAADVARVTGHPMEAVPLLRIVLEEHGSDARAPLAAFTLGRVLYRAGRAASAAHAFHQARALAPRGALAEDAWALEIESLIRAGDGPGAESRAAEYLRAFPDGHRAQAVRKLVAPAH